MIPIIYKAELAYRLKKTLVLDDYTRVYWCFMLSQSIKNIEGLMLELSGPSFNEQAISTFVYLLGGPERYLPNQVADVLTKKPEICIADSPFPGRFAYGVVEQSLNFIDLNKRETYIRRFRRQVNRMRRSLLTIKRQFELPISYQAKTINDFEEILGELRKTSNFTFELAYNNQLTKAEVGAVIEELLTTVSIQQDILENLFKRFSKSLSTYQKRKVLDQINSSIEDGFNNCPLDTKKQKIASELNEVRFQKENINDSNFLKQAKELPQTIEKAFFE